MGMGSELQQQRGGRSAEGAEQGAEGHHPDGGDAAQLSRWNWESTRCVVWGVSFVGGPPL